MEANGDQARSSFKNSKKQHTVEIHVGGFFFSFFTLPGQHFSLYGKEKCGNVSFCGLQRKESYTVPFWNKMIVPKEKLMTECSFLGGLCI